MSISQSQCSDNNQRLLSECKDLFIQAAHSLRVTTSVQVAPLTPDSQNAVRQASRIIGTHLANSNSLRIGPLSSSDKAPVDVIDLFSGCGGMSAGFRALSTLVPFYNIIGALDIDQHANKTYERNLGLTPLQLDINELLVEDSLAYEHLFRDTRHKNRPLVLIGCAPCQGFSSHRKKDKRFDERNSLVETLAKVAVRVQPDFVIMENVPELLAKKYWRHYELFKTTLEADGYYVRARIINMAEFGVPQERFRALVIASRRPFLMPSGFLRPQNFKTVRATIGHLESLVPGEPSRNDPMHVTSRHRKSTVNTIAQVPKNGGSRPFGIGPECLDRVKGFSDVYGRLYWDRPSITVTAYARNPASGRYSHPEQNRGLSIREAALLQGFPDDFRFDGPFDDKFKQIGNAVPPRFSAFLAAHMTGEILSGLLSEKEFEEDLRADITSPVSNSYSSVIAGIKAKRVKKR